jgi:hypothetical protein
MKANSWENELLLLEFNNTDSTGLGDAGGLRGSATAGSYHLSLHTSSPGETGNQTTNECAYSGYARKARARSGAGFTVSTNQVTLASNEDFGERTNAGSETAKFWGLGDASSGSGKLRRYGPINNNAVGPKVFNARVNNNLECIAHGLAVNDEIFISPLYDGSLPTGITEGLYFVLTAPDADTITISATQGGSVIDVTAVGAGRLQLVQGIVITQNTIPRLKTGSIIKED